MQTQAGGPKLQRVPKLSKDPDLPLKLCFTRAFYRKRLWRLTGCRPGVKKPVKVAATRQGVILDPMDRECLAALENIPYDTRYRVCRLGRAVRHKPQDRVVTPDFPPFSRLQAVGPQGAQATLWTNPAAGSEKPETGEILLTNRLIRTLYGREWIEGTEETPALEGAPLLVGADFEENYDLGLPKADQISRVYFSCCTRI